MPRGATPSRWCVCQFHHFRSRTKLSACANHAPCSEGKRDYIRRQEAGRDRLNSSCMRMAAVRGTILTMREEATDLLKKALALTAKERAELASSLIDSLDPISDGDVEAAWQAEIAHRLDDLRSGKVRTVPWEQVRNKARAILPDEILR